MRSMTKQIHLGAILAVLIFGLFSFSFVGTPRQVQDDTAWLKGSVDERFHTVARHLRGFDMAMVETGHRYTELYWAGTDGNWEYADYQIKKIRTSIENGLERRPKRAPSAQTFLTMVLPYLEEAIAKKDPTIFWNRFGALTSGCNGCHQNEQITFIEITPPKVRFSIVQKPE